MLVSQSLPPRHPKRFLIVCRSPYTRYATGVSSRGYTYTNTLQDAHLFPDFASALSTIYDWTRLGPHTMKVDQQLEKIEVFYGDNLEFETQTLEEAENEHAISVVMDV